MKLTFFLMTAAFLHVGAAGVAQKISYSGKNVSIKNIFTAIEKQSGYVFFYNNKDLKNVKPVTVNFDNVSLEEALDLCLKDQPLGYTIKGNTVFIIAKSPTPDLQSGGTSLPPPPVDVKGRIVNENGEPVIATVMVKGTKIGTTTNSNGEFQLRGIDENAVLVISGVSIETQELTIARHQGLKSPEGMLINAVAEVTSLKEVVINKGYYTEKQKYSVGNVSKINAAAIEKQPVQNPLLALQGRVTGVEITQLTGLPGGGVTVRIQGRNSLRTNALEPLIIIDGVPFPSQFYLNGRETLLQNGNPLNYINPDDIESIDILKDADATAIYGSRAANGAILIMTKKGKPGRSKININIQQGWGKVTRRADMMNTRQYLDMRYEYLKNLGIDLNSQSKTDLNYSDLLLWDTTRYTDWQKELIGGTARYSKVSASISGGAANVNYMIGANFNKQTTVFPGDFDDKRGGLHFNLNGSSPNQRFQVRLSGMFSYDNNHLPNIDLTRIAVQMEPNAPSLYSQSGELNWAPNATGTSTWSNPLAYTLSTEFNMTTKNAVSSLETSYRILEGLTLSNRFGYSFLQNDHYLPTRLERFKPERRATSNRTSSISKRSMSTWIIEPQLRYSKSYNNSKIEAQIGATIQQNTSDYLSAQGTGFPSDLLMKNLMAANSRAVSNASSIYKYSAIFGRLNYNMYEKYILNLTARRDGSTKFGFANKFHNFGSVGLGWIFSEEKWISRNLPFISFGKLHGSYGTTGNDQINDYLFLSTYQVSFAGIPYQGISGLEASGISNPHLQWEETRKLYGGIDLGFVDDRILLGAGYSVNKSSNQLISYQLPSQTGFIDITKNFPATIRNTSWEFTLNTTNIKNKTFSWTSNFNLTIPRNKLLSFPNIETTAYASGNNGVIIGQPLGVTKVYSYAGVNTTTGQYMVYDKDRNATSDYSPNILQDYLINIGTSTIYGGLNNSFSYKSIQLDIVFQLVRKLGTKDLYYENGNGSFMTPGLFAEGSNQPARLQNHWQKPGNVSDIAGYGLSPIMWPIYSNAYYSYDASFIRLKNASLSWHMPSKWLQKAKIQNCTFYFQGQNLITISKYSGLDPESMSINALPPLRMLTIGAKIEF